MPTTLMMPKLSPTMENGVIVKWMKKEGDFVKASDVLFEVATDKATVEHAALDDGYLRKILVKEGEEAKVNQAVAVFTESPSETIEGYQPVSLVKEEIKESPQEAASFQTQIKPSDVEKSTKMTQMTFSPSAPLENYEFEWPRDQISSKILASPLAKKLAKEKGVDLASIKGSGPNQRITKKDIELSQKNATVSFGRQTPSEYKPGAFEYESMTPIRKVIAERLQGSKSFIPHFYVKQTVVVDELVEIREQLKACDISLTFNDFVIRACAIALKEHPSINSGFDSKAQKIIRFQTVDISIAVSIAGGLITPIIRHANYKNIGELSTECKFLAKKAKEGALESYEYQGGSFTISNLGMYGIDEFSAIINPPQAAILAVGAIQETPIIKEGSVVAGKTLSLTLSVDHRVVDGSDAALFLQTVKKYLQKPAILLI